MTDDHRDDDFEWNADHLVGLLIFTAAFYGWQAAHGNAGNGWVLIVTGVCLWAAHGVWSARERTSSDDQ